MQIGRTRPVSRGAAFTLVEVMVVVAVIGLLSVIAIPAALRARDTAMINRYSSDMEVVVTAFVQYSFDHNQYPPDANPAQVPAGMSEYLKKVAWTKPDALGGSWDWDNGQFGITAGVSSYMPTASQDELKRYDALVDDGNLSTGLFRQRQDGYITVIEP